VKPPLPVVRVLPDVQERCQDRLDRSRREAAAVLRRIHGVWHLCRLCADAPWRTARAILLVFADTIHVPLRRLEGLRTIVFLQDLVMEKSMEIRIGRAFALK
jgi:hypothetical protein